ncbi:MAG: hypothetical protein HC933_09690 [Pleurocapsa sp. SU_196_0]|nr:hypothetical protein [Pleurocapsa sp. SU_196_0]
MSFARRWLLASSIVFALVNMLEARGYPWRNGAVLRSNYREVMTPFLRAL